ncbi:MAG: transglutaminase family protein [Pirellulales bacterium]|nr:transglutaminase family protein [Pirellulales bacterium]
MNSIKNWHFFPLAWVVCCALAFPVAARAQFEEEKPEQSDAAPKLDQKLVQRLKVGAKVVANGGPCAGLRITTPVPIDWPEQKVKVVEEKATPNVRNVTFINNIAGGVRQMVITIPSLKANEIAEAYTIYEIERHSLVPPEKTDELKIPPKPSNELKKYLGTSPLIELGDREIIKLTKELPAEATGWARVEAIYDLTRDKVQYKEGPIKGAAKAVRDGTGDCEELTSLFIALCRLQKIPARTVWVPGHCYPEFYLEDAAGKGNWYPCQAAGSRAFGGIPEHRPILQKGDNFNDPDRPKERLRYVSEFMKGSAIKGGGKPQVDFVREVLAQ